MPDTNDLHTHVDENRWATIAALVEEIADLTVGLGMFTFVLAPLAIPFLLLLALTLVPVLVIATISGILAAPVLLIHTARTRHRQSPRLLGLAHAIPQLEANQPE